MTDLMLGWIAILLPWGVLLIWSFLMDLIDWIRSIAHAFDNSSYEKHKGDL